MFFAIGKCIVAFVFFLVNLGAFASPPQEGVERKWMPHLIKGTHLAPGVPAFILILETKESACAKEENKIECYKRWEELPFGFQRIDEEEISYLHDYGDGFQRVRLSRMSFCALVEDLITEENSCQDLWWAFTRKKIRENT